MDSRSIRVYLFDSIMDFVDVLDRTVSGAEKQNMGPSEVNIFGVSIVHESFLVGLGVYGRAV